MHKLHVDLYLHRAVGSPLSNCWAEPRLLASGTPCSWRWCPRQSPAAASPPPCSLSPRPRVRANPGICLSVHWHLNGRRTRLSDLDIHTRVRRPCCQLSLLCVLHRNAGLSLWLHFLIYIFLCSWLPSAAAFMHLNIFLHFPGVAFNSPGRTDVNIYTFLYLKMWSVSCGLTRSVSLHIALKLQHVYVIMIQNLQ